MAAVPELAYAPQGLEGMVAELIFGFKIVLFLLFGVWVGAWC